MEDKYFEPNPDPKLPSKARNPARTQVCFNGGLQDVWVFSSYTSGVFMIIMMPLMWLILSLATRAKARAFFGPSNPSHYGLDLTTVNPNGLKSLKEE